MTFSVYFIIVVLNKTTTGDTMNFNDALQKIGFTPIEATVFITLCKNDPLSGYEVAKLCGISRSNVYAALYSLQEKGKCYVIESDTNKYVAQTKSELLLSSKREYDEVHHILETQYPETITSSDPYITIKGYDKVVEKIKNTLLTCTSHLYILSTKDCVLLFDKELKALSATKRITIISEQPLKLDDIKTYIKHKSPTGFHMIMDTNCVITGELGEQAHCLYTKNKSLVHLMRESFITELDMIKLTE